MTTKGPIILSSFEVTVYCFYFQISIHSESGHLTINLDFNSFKANEPTSLYDMNLQFTVFTFRLQSIIVATSDNLHDL